jgi:hypothetical protein
MRKCFFLLLFFSICYSCKLDAQTASDNNAQNSIRISSIYANGKAQKLSSPLILKSDQNNLLITFSSARKDSTAHNVFRYRLNEQEKWRYIKDSVIAITALDTGNYQLQIDRQLTDNNWENNAPVFSFSIQQPFWQKPWFIFAVSLAGSLVIGILLISIIAAFFLYYRYQRSQKNELMLKNNMLQSEIKALRAQMNPHFIFNSLNSIQHFIFANKKEEANEYLTAFSKLIRMTLDNSQINFIPIAEEVEFLTTYLKLEQLRLNHLFDFSFSYDDELNIMEYMIPSMMLQPFIENSIIHGITPKNSKSFIKIQFKLENNLLQCIIDDDGVGFPEGYQAGQSLGRNEKDHRSFGINALGQRIQTINQMHQTEIKFELANRYNDARDVVGARVSLFFKSTVIQ